MYEFKGFFVPHGEDLVDQIRTTWPTAQVRVIDEPFKGIGARFRNLEIWGTNRDSESVTTFKDELIQWSHSIAELTCVYVSAECWGGDCDYEGFVCKAGHVVADTPRSPESLRTLLDHLDVPSEEGDYFYPLTTGFPWADS